MSDTDSSAGWDAIDDALERLYPGVEPIHYGTLIGWRLGGPDPLDGISAFRRPDHWHFVTYGMSELYEKESELAGQSGWGFEFTFRVSTGSDQHDEQPPVWALNLLQNLARYVYSSGNPFAPGHHLDLNGPIALDRPETRIRALAFVVDPELGTIDTPHGAVGFLQLVGLTLEEYDAVQLWRTDGVLDAMAPRLPLLVTDLARGSLAEDPAVAAAIDEGVRREGSSTGSLFVEEASWSTGPDGAVITFGAIAANRLVRVLPGRLPHGRGLAVDTQHGGIRLRPGDELTATDIGDGYLEVALPRPVGERLCATVRPVAGRYPIVPGLTVEVVKSTIRDNEGNVVEEVG